MYFSRYNFFSQHVYPIKVCNFALLEVKVSLKRSTNDESIINQYNGTFTVSNFTI